MSRTWILHHSGDANVPPVRVAFTTRLAQAFPEATVLVPQRGAEADALEAWSYLRTFPKVRGPVHDTLAEALVVRALAHRGDRVIVSTERGHIRRAALIHRILFLGTGVAVTAPKAPGGNYRDAWWRLPRDGCRAAWARLLAALKDIA